MYLNTVRQKKNTLIFCTKDLTRTRKFCMSKMDSSLSIAENNGKNIQIVFVNTYTNLIVVNKKMKIQETKKVLSELLFQNPMMITEQKMILLQCQQIGNQIVTHQGKRTILILNCLQVNYGNQNMTQQNSR